jgi:hypothetical protein
LVLCNIAHLIPPATSSVCLAAALFGDRDYFVPVLYRALPDLRRAAAWAEGGRLVAWLMLGGHRSGGNESPTNDVVGQVKGNWYLCTGKILRVQLELGADLHICNENIETTQLWAPGALVP